MDRCGAELIADAIQDMRRTRLLIESLGGVKKHERKD